MTPEEMLRDGADLVVSISGGKDSQAMLSYLTAMREQRGWTGKLHVLHCDLGRMEWAITSRFIDRSVGQPVEVIEREDDLLQGIWDRLARLRDDGKDAPPFPSSAARYCTAGWKRGVTDVWARSKFEAGQPVLIAMGIRADESPARAKKSPFQLRPSLKTKSGKWNIWDWYPIFDWDSADIWNEIYGEDNGLERLQRHRDYIKSFVGTSTLQTIDALCEAAGFPAHPAYAIGNNRLSCSMCVLANENDIRNGARFHVGVYRELVDIEIESGYGFRQNLWLMDLYPELLREDQKTYREARITQPALL